MTTCYQAEDVTLYVPYFNAGTTIEECLAGIRKQTVTPRRIVVVDDGSRDPVPDGLEVVSHDRNRGLGNARNTALASCRTPLIAALDADVVPAPNWLEQLLAALNATGATGAGGRLDERYAETVADRWRAVHMCQHWGEMQVENPRFLYGSNTVFAADALRAVGAYDGRLHSNNEDRTASDALYEKGKRLVYAPAARCEHLRCDTDLTVLRGYWQWHHAKGLVRGDFGSADGVIRRIEEVNFGIFRYRFDLDAAAGRTDFFTLDAALPLVFCALDLLMLRRNTGVGPGRPQVARLFSHLFADAPHSLRPVAELAGQYLISLRKEDAGLSWWDRYASEFTAAALRHWRTRMTAQE